ncbi:hypothetical protein GQ42DRAFT_117548 [Ramicandelaber brevisporus]|nr:hypothetical protein GQ42DRAFT_117548 [Ramicandelaber brevisporus]
MKNWDPSHDFLHVDRVRNNALRIASLEPSARPIDIEVVELAALLHDVYDTKYVSVEEAAAEGVDHIANILVSNGFDAERTAIVKKIVDNISYRKEKRNEKEIEEKKKQAEANGVEYVPDEITVWRATCKELHIVMDSDKLDAIGAIGALRCAAYNASRGYPIYDPVDPMNPVSAIGHHYEKLLKLHEMMKTEVGRKEAERRSQSITKLVEEIRAEMAFSSKLE